LLQKLSEDLVLGRFTPTWLWPLW